MVNLLVDLDERFNESAVREARDALERAGYTLEIGHGAPDRALAWIDHVFGGAWSGEANLGTTLVASHNGAPAGFATVDPQGLRYAWLRGAAAQDGVAIFGPFGVDPEHRGGALGRALLALALAHLKSAGYRRALIAAVAGERLIAYYQAATGATVAERFDPASFTPKPVRTVVLASGSGTNFQSVVDAVAAGFPLEVRALVSNRAQAYAVERAKASAISAEIVTWKRSEETRAHYDRRVLDAVAAYEPELVLLLGWMHLLSPEFVSAFPELLNVHPAFLPLDSSRDWVGLPDGSTMPAFRGAHAVADALAAGAAWVGASVHVVTPETDRGPILIRKPLRVIPGEDEAQLLARLHPLEHDILKRGIARWLYER